MASAYRLQIVHKGEVVEWMPGSKVETDTIRRLEKVTGDLQQLTLDLGQSR